MTIFAPAKINLYLQVYGRRPDGYHNLESMFLALDFGDTLHFDPIPGEKTEIYMEGPAAVDIPIEENIVYKALTLFREKTDFNQNFRIKVEKKIPVGGGLGGGSSNAASTLLALNKMANLPLKRPDLLEMALALGSDVPFFIYETDMAEVKGRGEFIEPVESEILKIHDFIVLVNPGFPSDTAAAFKLWDEYSQTQEAMENVFYALPSYGSNAFLHVLREPEKSVYTGIIAKLTELGAESAGLSGSGSTCFGIFKEKEQAEKAVEILRDNWKFVECCCVKKNDD
jgi:4-diphosphocytidyl-2-C-methyl-D-erythritol kinase